MRYLNLFIALLFVTSCSDNGDTFINDRDLEVGDGNPVITVYVSAEESNYYTKATFINRKVRLTKLDENGNYERVVSDIFSNDIQVEVELDLENPNSVFIYEMAKPEGSYAGLRLDPINIKITNKDGVEFNTFNEVNSTSASYDFPFHLEADKNYRIDCVIDFDESIPLDSLYNMYPEVSYEISEI